MLAVSFFARLPAIFAGWMLFWGIVSASSGAQGPATKVSLEVVDAATGFVVAPAQATALNLRSGTSATLDAEVNVSGKRTLALEGGRHEMTVDAPGYQPATGVFELNGAELQRLRFVLDPVEPPTELKSAEIAHAVRKDAMLIQGFIADGATGGPLPGARIISSRGVAATADERGFFRLFVPVTPGAELDYSTSLRFERDGFQAEEHAAVEIWERGDWTYRVALAPGSGVVAVDERLSRGRASAAAERAATAATTQRAATPTAEIANTPVIQATELTNSTVRVPRQIRVLLADGATIEYVSMNYYARAVLASEWIPSWANATGGSNSLNAGAVAVRCYAIAKLNAAGNASTYDICATTSCQVYNPSKINSLTDRAVTYTENYVVVTSGGVIPSTEYSAENNQLGLSCGDGFTAPSGGCLYDPVCAGEAKYGHGRGMCQWGTARWATGRQMAGRVTGDTTPNGYPRRDWRWMVEHYYPGNFLVKGQPLLIGDTVKPLKTLDARACPGDSITNGISCPLVASRATSARGTIIAGPTLVTNDTTHSGFNWYQIQWTDGVTGWSVENYLERVFAVPGNAPSPFFAAGVVSNRVNLVWNDKNQAETGYTIERAAGATGPWSTLRTLPQNTVVYSDLNVLPGNVYYYRLKAFNPAGDGPYSGTVVVTTPAAPPVINPIPAKTVVETQPLSFAITAQASDARRMLVDFEPFPTETANGVVLFRDPRYSGSTSGNLGAAPNVAAVTDAFPDGNGTGLVLRVSCDFTNATDSWLRLTTAGTAYWPNPVIDLSERLVFDIWCDKPLRVALGVRESVVPAGTIPGSNGGTSGAIEWVGATNPGGNIPMPNRLVPAGAWTTLSFDFPTEPTRSFSGGNGVLATSSGLAVFEHVALVPLGTGVHNIYLDNFALVKPRSLAYTLGAGAPAGAGIDVDSGVFTWIPTEAQGPGSYQVPVLVADNAPLPAISSNWFVVSVLESNLPPVLESVADRTVHAGSLVVITNVGSDPDLPLQGLSFSLAPGAPAGAAIDSVTGILTWQTLEEHANNSWPLGVRLSDDFNPSVSAFRGFSVTVLPRPAISSFSAAEGEIRFAWSAIPGTSYLVQYRDDLVAGGWQDAGVIVAGVGTAAFAESLGAANRFYRVLVKP